MDNANVKMGIDLARAYQEAQFNPMSGRADALYTRFLEKLENNPEAQEAFYQYNRECSDRATDAGRRRDAAFAQRDESTDELVRRGVITWPA